MNDLKSLLFLLFFSFGITFTAFSQNFSGKIINHKDKQPATGATILIEETKQGLACNENGEFQVKLKPGSYHVNYRCLGYETVSETVNIPANDRIYRKIELKSKEFNLKEVVISNKEDPAYEIMRKAIAKAPFYQRIVKNYEAECYIKGNMEMTKVNKLLDGMTGSDDGVKASEYKNKLFVQESYSTVKFTSPDKYEQTVKAFKSSIPDNRDPKDAMSIFQSSIYQPKYTGCISPLNPKAFSYYRFRYEGFTEENGENINKIKIIPKVKDPELLSGYIYIADNSWDVRNAELSSTVFGINKSVAITYGKLSESVYLPTAFNMYLSGSILGFGGNFSYHSSVKYNNLEVNDSIRNEIKPKSLKKKKNLNITESFKDLYMKQADSLATKRDSAYWKEIRNVPLNQKEMESYAKRDSIQTHLDSIRKKKTDPKFELSDLFTGGQIGGKAAKYTLNYGGILGILRDYNFVDGFGLGQKFTFNKNLSKATRLSIVPEVYYTTARKALAWQTDLHLDYAPMKVGNLSLSFGDRAVDFNPEGAVKIDNAYASLVHQKNISMFYRKKFTQFSNKIDLANGLQLNTALEFARRSPLQNNTTFSIFKNKENISENIQSKQFSDLTSYTVGLSYTPEYYYSVSNGAKVYQYSHYPTFKVNYTEGFSSIWSNNSHFRKLDAYVSQDFNTSLFSKISYELNGGAFLGKTDRMNFADYKFFNSSGNFYLTQKTPLTAFMLLNPYSSATNDYWFSAKMGYSSKYILLKYLPFMQGKLFNESILLKYLYTPTQKNYVEAGYYIDLFKILNLGVNVSFDKMKYDSWGIRLAIPLNIRGGKIEISN